MAAPSLLTDVENAYGWDGQSPRACDTVRYLRPLVAAVLRIVVAQAEPGDATGTAVPIDDALNHLAEGHNGSHRS